MTNISIHDFVVLLLCGIILLFMIWYSSQNVFNKKKIIIMFDVLTFIQVRKDKNKFLHIRRRLKWVHIITTDKLH